MFDFGASSKSMGIGDGLVWMGNYEFTVAHLSEPQSGHGAWRSFLNRLRRVQTPLLLRLGAHARLSKDQRAELAEALGPNLPVAVVADGQSGAKLATALRWEDVDALQFRSTQLKPIAKFLDVEVRELRTTLTSIESAA